MIDLANKTQQMIASLLDWLECHNYRYVECNYVPDFLFNTNKKWNVFLRTLFRLSPINLRSKKSISNSPLTPQTQVALLKAYNIIGNKEILKKIFSRIEELRSSQTKHFALKQGIRIAINLYEDSSETPTPLNTVWLGQFLLDLNIEAKLLSNDEREKKLRSICSYLIEDLGYEDYKDKGIYFYYGASHKKTIYNASALISAFLIRVGFLYNERLYQELGYRGIEYIVNQQNEDGSWFYAASPERSTIDSFHQSYILQALSSVRCYFPLLVEEAISKGERYYHTLFIHQGNYIIPKRYDKRFTPRNTWLFQKLDGRDITEALIYFSRWNKDVHMIEGLINYLYKKMYLPEKGYISPERFTYARNNIPYSEFQAWYLYALSIVNKAITSDL